MPTREPRKKIPPKTLQRLKLNAVVVGEGALMSLARLPQYTNSGENVVEFLSFIVAWFLGVWLVAVLLCFLVLSCAEDGESQIRIKSISLYKLAVAVSTIGMILLAPHIKDIS